MSTYRNLTSLCAAVVLALGLAACGGGGDGPMTPTLTLDGVQMGTTVEAGTHPVSDDLAAAFSEDDASLLGQEFAEGAMVTAGGLDFTCSTGPCSVVLNDDGTVTTTGTIMVAEAMVGPVEPPAPTELETAQTAASDAADAAKMASDNAATAAENAMTAGENLATMQTGAKSGMYAKEAQDAADKAMAAYMSAKSAAADAAAATTITEAVLAQGRAEAAQADAEKYAKMASDKGTAAETAAGMELKIAGTMKSVGGSSVDAMAGMTSVTTGTGANAKTTTTGLISEPVTAGATTDGRAPVDGSLTDATVYKSPMVNAAARGDVKIGKTLDTSDDAARLLIVTHHTGTNTVRVYDVDAGATDLHTRTDSEGTTTATGASAPADATGYTGEATLKSEGMFYRARAIPAADGTITDTAGLQPESPTDDPLAQAGDSVGAKAKPAMVYSYTDADSNKVYVVESTRTVTGGVTTVTYQTVQTRVAVNRDGDPDTGVTEAAATAAGVDSGGWTAGDELVQVTAKLPVRSAYDHVHFGVWASLKAPVASGANSIADLGIGFVQSIGDGMTGSDMPNNGSASYSGNWAAAIQEADSDGDGNISLTTGAASVTANFTKGSITATLSELATLKGDITGNTFSGTDASATGGGLDVEGDFTGSFSGGFYGTKADETAGVFDFASDGNKAGAFRGAFGGQRNPE